MRGISELVQHMVTEKEVGIAWYEDFHVREVDEAGNVVRLSSTDLPAIEEARSGKELEAAKAVQEAGEVRPAARGPGAPPDPRAQLVAAAKRRRIADGAAAEESAAAAGVQDEAASLLARASHGLGLLEQLVGPECAARVREVLERAGARGQGEDAGSAVPAHALLPPIPDKNTRTQVHMAVREHLSMFVSDTVDVDDGTAAEAGGKVIRLRLDTGKKNPEGLKRARDAGFDPRGRFRWPFPDRQFVHFTMEKANLDTQAIRVQPKEFAVAGTKDRRGVTTQRVSARRVLPARVKLAGERAGNVRVGDFAFASRPLGLGALGGNEFSIVLRDVQGDEDAVRARVDGLQRHGFVNYFGLQRFGTTSVSSHAVGRLIIRRAWQDAPPNLLTTLHRQAVRLLLSPRRGEDADVVAARNLFLDGADADAAARALPYRLRTEHHLLSALAKHGATQFAVALQNLPRTMRSLYCHAWQSSVWNSAATRRVELYGAEGPVEGDLVLVDGDSDSHGAAPAPAPGGEGAIQVAEDETEAGGEAPCISAGARVHVVTQADVAAGRFAMADVVLPVPGYESVLPANRVRETYDELMERDGITREMLRDVALQIHLNGDYRRVVCRPSGLAWELRKYSDARAPLQLADSDVLEGKQVPATDGGDKTALLISFRLPPSSYATIALRELTGMSSWELQYGPRTRDAAAGAQAAKTGPAEADDALVSGAAAAGAAAADNK